MLEVCKGSAISNKRTKIKRACSEDLEQEAAMKTYVQRPSSTKELTVCRLRRWDARKIMKWACISIIYEPVSFVKKTYTLTHLWFG
jgi:hypothetical protein